MSISEQVSPAASGLRATTHLPRMLVIAVVLCYIVYLLQMLSPLRMTTDSIEYLSVATSVSNGKGFHFLGRATQHPPGYAGMIAVLDHMGIARPWSLVGLNCGFLLLGLVATQIIARKAFSLASSHALFICFLTLLNFVIVKHTALVLSDVPFFGLSLASLAALPLAAPGKNEPARGTRLALSIILLIAATLTRSIGVTLLPALGWSLMRLTGFEGRMRSNRRFLWGCLLSLVAMLTLAAWLFFHSMYGGMFTETYSSHGLLRTWVHVAVVRTQELGELTLNIPTSKVPAAGRASLLAGVFSTIVLSSGFCRRRRGLTTADIYLLACLAGLLVTPWPEAVRYWIPVVPLIIAALFAELTFWWSRLRVARIAVYAICSLYIAMGVLATGYSTRITFSGNRFPEIYGSGSTLAPTYRLYLRNQLPSPGENVNAEALQVLRHYGGQ